MVGMAHTTAAAHARSLYALSFFALLSMKVNLARADGIPPTYPPSSAPSSAPLRGDSLASCLNSISDLSIGAQLVGSSPQTYQLNSSATNITLFMPTNKAFATFAASLGVNLTNDTDVRSLPYLSTLSLAIRYHMLTRRQPLGALVKLSSANGTDVTFSTSLGTANYASLKVTAYANSSLYVYGSSSSAKVIEYDIQCGNSTLNIIDTVLQHWYSDIDSALAANFLDTMRKSLQENNLTATLATLNGTIFAPYDSVFNNAQLVYNYDFTNSVDTLTYHVVTERIMLLSTIRSNNTYKALNSKNLTVTTLGNKSDDSPVVTTYISGGVTASVTLPPIPVGIAPSYYIYKIDKVLIPEYTNVMQVLDSSSSFSIIRNLVKNDLAVKSKLAEFTKGVTFFAPTDVGVRQFVAEEYGTMDVTAGTFKDRLRPTLQNHIVERAFSFGSLFNSINDSITAVFGRLWFSAKNSVTITVRSQATSANTVSPTNITVLYGRSYVHAINYMLSPYDGNGVATAGPSLLLLGLSLLAARLLAAMQ